MLITDTMPRVTKTIEGFSVTVPAPFAAGDPLTEATAAMLNQTFSENIGNNTRAKLKLGIVLTEGAEATPYTDETAQILIDAYVAEYEPGVRRGGGGEARVTDPVEREARKIAKQKATELVKANGGKTTDYDMADLTDKVFEANRDVLMAEGKKIVAALEKAKKGAAELDLGGISLEKKEVPASEVTE